MVAARLTAAEVELWHLEIKAIDTWICMGHLGVQQLEDQGQGNEE